MGFSWKFLIPLSLINIFMIAIEKYVLVPHDQTVLTLHENTVLTNLPILHTGSVIGNWLIWVVVAAVVFGGFFFLMSRLLSEKLEARLARR